MKMLTGNGLASGGGFLWKHNLRYAAIRRREPATRYSTLLQRGAQARQHGQRQPQQPQMAKAKCTPTSSKRTSRYQFGLASALVRNLGAGALCSGCSPAINTARVLA